MDKGPDQDTRDDPDGLVEVIAENDSDDLYAPPEQVPEKTVRRPVDEVPDNSPDDLDLDSLDDAVETVRSLLADRYDDVSDIIRPPLIDAVPGDDLKPGSAYDFTPMVCAWIYRLIAPSDGYSVVSWEDLADRLDENDELAANLGFDGDTPSEKTLRTQWQTRIRPGFRDHVRYMAAECAVKAEEYELETAEDIRDNLIAEHRPDEPEVDPIGEMEQGIKEDAYSIQAEIIRDVCSYDRDDSSEWESHLFTDAAAHMCRRNEYAEQGIERMGKDYGLIEEHEDGSEEWNVFTQQTFRRTVRNVERTKIDGYYDDDDDAYGARWLPPHDLVDPAIVTGDLRDALEESWTIDPHNPDGETATWHLRTEEAIERQIEWLRDEEQGVIDEDDTFNLRIDYTTHNYSKHSSTDSDAPVGVHKQTHLETGYAWKELQGTIKINGRAFIIASLSYTPQNDQFQGVRYILDRARELVNIDTVMADAEFVDTKICRYIRQCGCDYAIRKGATDTVKDTVEGFEGRADWDSNWTLMSSGRRKTHNTTLVGLEKDFKSVPDHKKKDDEEDEPDTTLDDFGDDEDDGLDDQQLTLKQIAEESHQDEEEIDYFCIITSKSVDRAGIDPDENPIGHDPEGSAWGIGRLYRDRWGVETAFRDKKGTFAAKTRSRDPGYRRFLWMMENLLYNGWVMLNTAVADQSPDRDDDEIVVKQATYLDELDRRVLSGLSLDLEFPDVEFG